MRREAFVQRIDDATLAAFDIATTYLGLKLGLYRSLHDDGPATSAQLAQRTGTNERLVREWLEQQGASELLTAIEDGGQWRFALPPGHAEVLLDRVRVRRGAAGRERRLPAVPAAALTPDLSRDRSETLRSGHDHRPARTRPRGRR